MSESPDTPTVVLVHGGFADASFWAPVIRDLQARNLPVLEAREPAVVPGTCVAAPRCLHRPRAPPPPPPGAGSLASQGHPAVDAHRQLDHSGAVVVMGVIRPLVMGLGVDREVERPDPATIPLADARPAELFPARERCALGRTERSTAARLVTGCLAAHPSASCLGPVVSAGGAGWSRRPRSSWSGRLRRGRRWCPCPAGAARGRAAAGRRGRRGP
jgi:hypothetical protein